jgi:hypothetical protein
MHQIHDKFVENQAEMLDHHNSDVEKTIFDRKSKGTIFPELL